MSDKKNTEKTLYTEKTPSKEKREAIEKYGEDGIYELKIRDSKTDPTLFYLINAIDKDLRAEACREILKRALTDIYFGINETELVKQEDLVNYLSKSSKAKVPTTQWLFSSGALNNTPTINKINTENITIEANENIKDNSLKENNNIIEDNEDTDNNDIDNNEDTKDNIDNNIEYLIANNELAISSEEYSDNDNKEYDNEDDEYEDDIIVNEHLIGDEEEVEDFDDGENGF